MTRLPQEWRFQICEAPTIVVPSLEYKNTVITGANTVNTKENKLSQLTTELQDIRVIDADTHVIEPPDLWTSRLPKSFADAVPRVDINPGTGHNHWKIGQTWLHPVGFLNQAGWADYPPFAPSELEETDPAGYLAPIRLERMDEYGIDVQLLYPNVIGFQAPLFMELGDKLSLECTSAYNDFLSDWCAADRRRLIPIAMVPFWNTEAAVREMRRCADLGFRGVLFANKYERIGLPNFCDPHWDTIYQAASDLDLSINYHIGFASPEFGANISADGINERKQDVEAKRPDRAAGAAHVFMGQYETLGRILTSGVLKRFPTLKFVSVESGFGYIPYYLEALDWHWQTYGAHVNDPVLPSEYFRRQCYGTFWFERGTLPLLELYPDNFMYSTDFPHPTSMSPGPASPAQVPSKHIASAFADIRPEIARKALHDNAAMVYHLD